MAKIGTSLPLVAVAAMVVIAFSVSFATSTDDFANRGVQRLTEVKPESPELNRQITETRTSSFDEQILAIAQNYKEYGLVDDEARWSPWLCDMPEPARVRFSKSDDSETHGEKLYLLYAKNRNAYVQIESTEPEVGQVVVKESWHPVKMERLAGQTNDSNGGDVAELTAHDDSVISVAEQDGVSYEMGEFAGLYIMLKRESDAEGTDNGWIYATVAADGKTITSSGKIDSCISCHQEAPHDRLFGLKD